MKADDLASVIERKKTRQGADLATLSLLSPVLVVFLRHAGCMFCRETLSDVARLRPSLETAGVRIVLVYHGKMHSMSTLLTRYGLGNLDQIHDNDLTLYRAFGLRRGSLRQVMGLRVWPRAFAALRRHGVGIPQGDPLQMPGVFVLHHCEVLNSLRSRTVADQLLANNPAVGFSKD